MKNLILTIDLLPKGAWGNNLSKILPKKDWDILRQKCYEKAINRCVICGFDSSYFLVFNYKTGKFEVHSYEQRGSSLCLILPYSSLDERTLLHVKKTQSENRRQFLDEMERENEKLEKARIEKISKNAEKETEKAFRQITN
ncbi:MAG: hypothetical protein FWE22_00150 [Firmicutes bacterium]|nr:hypothetical protein [Bacillota bacterium]